MESVRSLNPTCEDYNSDDSEDHVLDYRRSPAAAGQANVAAKRSHPSDLGLPDKTPVAEKVVNIDLQSDSGYSSHTAGTMSSADSAPSAKLSQSPPTPVASAAPVPPPTPATSRRRPTIVPEDRKGSSQNSPRKPLQRTSSAASRRPPGSRRSTVTEECKDPNCTKCGPNALPQRGRRPGPSPLDSGLDVSFSRFDQRSQRSDAAPSYTSPPSPMYGPQPARYVQGSAVVQPGQTRRRSSTARQRPVSYHGDPGPGYWVANMPAPYPSPPQEQHGPPPSISAHYNMSYTPQISSFLPGSTPPSNYYPSGHPMTQTSPPHDLQRPPLSARNSSFQTRRPPSGYGPTLVTYEQGNQPMPSARYPSAPQSARQERFPQSQFDSESSEYGSSEEDDDRNARAARALMPPPKLKSTKERRPSPRHANTTQVYNERRMSHSQRLPEWTMERDPRASRISSTAPSRTPSVSRPALTQYPKAHSAHETPRPAQVLVENSKSRRSQSYQSYEKQYDFEDRRRNRDSKIYHDDRDEAVLVAERRRRRTDADLEPKERRTAMDAEAYQQRTRGSNDPLTEQVHKAAKRASRVASGPSDAGSSRSKGSDKASRITTSGGNGEIRLRVDASAPLSLSFNGDMEGRTLQINPAEGGMADIVIGSSRGNENVYRSEKGSVVGGSGGSSRKSLVANQARREVEESSVRSGRSSQGRREAERRVLRRRRDTEYN